MQEGHALQDLLGVQGQYPLRQRAEAVEDAGDGTPGNVLHEDADNVSPQQGAQIAHDVVVPQGFEQIHFLSFTLLFCLPVIHFLSFTLLFCLPLSLCPQLFYSLPVTPPFSLVSPSYLQQGRKPSSPPPPQREESRDLSPAQLGPRWNC